MSEIKALVVVGHSDGIKLTTNHIYEFTYSKTGSVKYTGKYKSKYFKKEFLNSYESIELGKNRFMLFTEDFNIDENKCYKSILELFISNSNAKIERLKENIISLKKQLSNY